MPPSHLCSIWLTSLINMFCAIQQELFFMPILRKFVKLRNKKILANNWYILFKFFFLNMAYIFMQVIGNGETWSKCFLLNTNLKMNNNMSWYHEKRVIWWKCILLNRNLLWLNGSIFSYHMNFYFSNISATMATEGVDEQIFVDI